MRKLSFKKLAILFLVLINTILLLVVGIKVYLEYNKELVPITSIEVIEEDYSVTLDGDSVIVFSQVTGRYYIDKDIDVIEKVIKMENM